MFQKNLAINLLMGFFFLYLLASLLFLGVMLKFLLQEIFEMPPAHALNGLLIYSMAGGLFLRFLIQRLPLLDITSYLHLPVGKGRLLHYVFLKTFLSVYNLIPFAFILPFFFAAVLPAYPWANSLAWLLTLTCVVLFNNLLAFYIKKAFVRSPWGVFLFGIVLLAVFTLDYYGFLQMMGFSRLLFDPVLNGAYWVLIPMLCVAFAYLLLYRWMKGFLRLDAGLARKAEKVKSESDLGLKRFGTVGRMAAFELDMIRRNKRPKTFALVAFFFLLYGLLFYPNPSFEGSYSMMIFVGVFTTGIFMIQFGQLHFSWDSPHFDKLLTTELRVRDYILSKYLLMVLSVLVMFVLSLPYVYFGTEVIFINFCSMLFNIGFGTMVLLFLALYNRKGMNLSKSGMMNFEGVQLSQFLLLPFILGLPFVIYGIFFVFGKPFWGIGAIGLVGFLSMLLHPYLLRVLERMFKERKHLIAEGFRSS